MSKDRGISISQSSGLGSDSSQNQQIQIADNIYNGSVYKKLVNIHSNPITFDPNSLRDVIIHIDEGIDSVDTESIDYDLGIDIEEKNQINNHSDEYFDEFVKLDFYPQFYKLEGFLRLKENQRKLQTKLDRVIKSLNRQIFAHQGNEYFESILLKITTKLIDENHENLKNTESEILLILYFLYCNCCIGRKTKEEKNASSQ
jgi:hypothetical protein|tara:strand:- start:4575 stop:5177 length:603 start_codon:yes stop_codon:yes gene_type:complete